MDHGVVHSDVDRYIIVEYLAEGGMGAIFLGKKLGLEGFEKEVVLKQLLPEFTSQREFIDLFLREAKLSASLDHANIVHTLDLVASQEDYFIVMEYVCGGDLRTILRRIKQRGHRLAPGATLFIAREILSALAYAHEKKGLDNQPLGIIHRDISPSNIMISVAGEVKLTDFGIAKAATHQSVYYRVKGKVGYMSPEQAFVDRELDQRSDLYSAAVCLYEMMRGERLFVADILSTPDKIYSQVIPPLAGIPGVPLDMEGVMAKALAREPDERYQTAIEFQDALVKVAYDNGMLMSAPDLAQHLRKVCGADPATWHLDVKSEDADRRAQGTEVLSDEHEHLSGVQLTSIFAGDDVVQAVHGGRAARERSDPFVAQIDEQEATRHVSLPPRDEAEEPTRFQQKPQPPGGPVGSSTTEFRRQSRPPGTGEPARAQGWFYDPGGDGDGWQQRTKPGAASDADGFDEEPTAFVRQADLERYHQGLEANKRQNTVSLRSPQGQTNPRAPVPGPPSGRSPTMSPSPGRSPTMSPSPGRSPTLPPPPGRSPTLPPSPGRSPTLPPSPGRSPILPPSPGRSPTLPPGRSLTLSPGRSLTLPPGTSAPGPGRLPPRPELTPPTLPPHTPSPRTLAERVGPRPREATVEVGPDSAVVFQTEESRRPGGRSRRGLLVVVAMLALGSGVITAMVAFSGPDLREHTPDTTPPPASDNALPGQGEVVPDATVPDQRPPDRSLPGQADGPGPSVTPMVPDTAGAADSGYHRSGALRVASFPADALVYLDGVYQCNTPCTVEELSASQVYLLSVRRKEYQSWSSLVDLGGLRQINISAYLTRKKELPRVLGYLQINSRPAAEVYIDGKQIGRVTSEGKIPLAPGEYEVTLSHPRRSKRPTYLVTIARHRTRKIRVKF